MGKSRLEAFSDGVLAIIITIMVLELHVPRGDTLKTLEPLVPVFFSYVLSFLNIGIYWNNHHHMLMAARHISGGVMWANLNLLFWLSLFPFVTGWMGENHLAAVPTALYGVVMFMAGLSFKILERTIVAADGETSLLRTVGMAFKGTLSLALLTAGIVTALYAQWAAQALYTAVALIWLVPDRQIERAMREE
jgi:uncharacterized membrane protein